MTTLRRRTGSEPTVDFHLDVARGLYPELGLVRKFGVVPEVNAGDPPIDIWEFGQLQKTYLFPIWGTAPIDRICSDNAGDTQPIMIQGLDINGYEVLQEITLTGTTPVPLTTPLWRCYRVWNNDMNMTTGQGVPLLGSVYVFDDTPAPLGIPTDPTKVRAVILIENNQTQMMIYTVPKGMVAYMTRGETGLQKAGNQASSASIQFRVRPFGGVFRTSKTVGLVSDGNSYFSTERKPFQVIPELTDIKATCSNMTGVNPVALFAEITMIIESVEEAP